MISSPNAFSVALAAESPEARKGFTFSSPPKTNHPRTSIKQEKGANPAHMMFDRRIHRGSNFSLATMSKNDPIEVIQKIQQSQKKNTMDRISQQTRVETPDAVAGRQHLSLQTDLYLEELALKVPERDVFTMTDAFIDRPPTPLYVPVKSGVDTYTQIYEGELFDFDLEVEPILQVLVGKIVEQSFMEVLEEEELKELKEQQVKFENRRMAELAEVQRLEEAERRRTEEKQRRLAEKEKLHKEKQEMTLKIAAQHQAQMVLRSVIPNVFDALTTNGYFYDVVEKQIETEVLPWVTTKLQQQLDLKTVAYNLIDVLIRDAIKLKRGQILVQ